MIKITLAYPYNLGAVFGTLREVKVGQKLSDVWRYAYGAEQALTTHYTESLYRGTLRTSLDSAGELLNVVKKLTARTDYDAELDFLDVYTITESLKKFEAVFTAELASTQAYFVSQKGGYDTLQLSEFGESNMPADFVRKAPGALTDIRAAGKCIAFELCTAAGFHMIRGLECVLLQYFDTVAATKTPAIQRPKSRNIGALLNAMESNGLGEPKVLAVLKQIKDLHRNPLMHPEDTLSLDDAIGLFGIVQSAVAAMLPTLPEPPPAEAPEGVEAG